jgi:hypothetical protein
LEWHFFSNELPRLFSFAKNKQITLAQFTSNSDVHHNFHTPLSEQAANELLQLHIIIEETQQNQLEKDVWGYIWGNRQYTSARYYALNFKYIEAPEPFKWFQQPRRL